jgi:hypothetical protein
VGYGRNSDTCDRNSELEHLEDREDIDAVLLEKLFWSGDFIPFMLCKVNVVWDFAGGPPCVISAFTQEVESKLVGDKVFGVPRRCILWKDNK